MGFAINEFDHVLASYLIDTYTSVAGSACAPLGFIRAVLSAVSPVLGSHMFRNMNNNLAATIIAVIATVYLGVAVMFFCYGKRFREASPWVKAHAKKHQSKDFYVSYGGQEIP
jgi:vacuolar-type H+-ATPase subunit I/STV1